MLKGIIISVILIIFPIFLGVETVFSKDIKRLCVLVKVFGIKILSGYFEVKNDGIYFHITAKKAIYIPYKSLFGFRKKMKPLQDYHFLKFYLTADIGSKNNSLTSMNLGFLLSYANWYVCRYFSLYKPYLDIQNNINVYENSSVFNLYFSGTIVFNLLMILLSIIKILTEKFIYAIGKGKQ